MFDRWKPVRLRFWRVLRFLVLFGLLLIEGCSSINDEGWALLQFRMRLESDPFGALVSWNSSDSNPCEWTGVHCIDGHVYVLDLNDLSLGGILAPELGRLSKLRSLVLNNNNFFGAIPKEITKLNMLENIDLRGNQLSGTLPVEIGELLSLKRLLICDNQFEGCIPAELGKLKMLIELRYDENIDKIDCMNRKFRQRIKFRRDNLQGYRENCYDNFEGFPKSYIEQNVLKESNPPRRELLDSSNSNLAAPPVSGGPLIELSTIPSLASGSFPAIRSTPPSPSPSPSPASAVHSFNSSVPQQHSTAKVDPGKTSTGNTSNEGSGNWNYFYVLPAGAFLLTAAAAVLFLCQKRPGGNIGPWKTGLSGQLQKAFVTGVPKLNRAELETACEDFSNIIGTMPDCTMYKGTLSSGVEIAVVATTITSAEQWSDSAEMHFRKKIDALSRVNHKNFVNLLGYCEEEEPFLRMMVMEYAPSGSLFDHLHAKGFEHLDWFSRMRIILGVAYCLQYMHHELNPPVTHSNLTSHAVYLTDDYAAKIAEFQFWKEFSAISKVGDDENSDPSEFPLADQESNVYSFGVLMLEIISGKLPYSEEQGYLVSWASENLNDRRTISHMVDPTLKSFKNNELDIVCEVILECTNQDPRQRPTMKEVTTKLRDVLGISQDAATPKLSPLWWAELEILSLEAS